MAEYRLHEIRDVSLLDFPGEREFLSQSQELTIGDMHGNALKFIHFLISEGVLKLERGDADYQILVQAYQCLLRELAQGDALSADAKTLVTRALEDFSDVLTRSTLCEVPCTVRLIGDELADRGACDLLTLKIYEKLAQRPSITVVTLMSNHSEDFYQRMEYASNCSIALSAAFRSSEARHVMAMDLKQTRSMIALAELIENNIVSEADVLTMVGRYHQPTLKAVDYTLYANQIIFYSHAPVSAGIVSALYQSLGLQPQWASSYNRSVTKFTQAIDAINQALRARKAPYDIFCCRQLSRSDKAGLEYNLDHRIALLWFRSPQDYERPQKHAKKSIHYVHGHVGPLFRCNDRFTNLDGDLGHPDYDYGYSGLYCIVYADPGLAPSHESVIGAEKINTSHSLFRSFLNIFNPYAHTGWKQHVLYGLLATFIISAVVAAAFFTMGAAGLLPGVVTAVAISTPASYLGIASVAMGLKAVTLTAAVTLASTATVAVAAALSKCVHSLGRCLGFFKKSAEVSQAAAGVYSSQKKSVLNVVGSTPKMTAQLNEGLATHQVVESVVPHATGSYPGFAASSDDESKLDDNNPLIPAHRT